MVIGGFHLQNDHLITRKSIEWLQSKNVEQVIPSHCTSFDAQTAIYRSFHFSQVKSGNMIQIMD